MRNTIIGIVLAGIFWFFLFSPVPSLAHTIHNHYFWPGMFLATAVLTAYAFFQQKNRLAELFRFEKKFILIGLGHAVFLYGFSQLGVFIATSLFDWAGPQIQAIYQTRTQAHSYLIASLLLFWIGPSEEIFWRGFVQNRLMEYLGATKGTILAVFLYAFVHIWAMNPMLLLAALVLGVHWSIMYRRTGSLVPGIISHALWDAAVFVFFPIRL